MFLRAATLALTVASASATRYLLDAGWRFELNGGTPPSCADPNATFPVALDNQQCSGLHDNPNVANLEQCIDTCCADDTCNTYQWCPADGATCAGGGAPGSCWTGPANVAACAPGPGWVSRGRSQLPPPPPAAGDCTVPECDPATDDSAWRALDLPHDFVVEGNFSESASTSQGYLPFGIGWYRRHLIVPAELSASNLWLELDGAQTDSTVYLNGKLLGPTHSFGYTESRYFVNNSVVNFGAANLLAIKVDGTHPDGWCVLRLNVYVLALTLAII